MSVRMPDTFGVSNIKPGPLFSIVRAPEYRTGLLLLLIDGLGPAIEVGGIVDTSLCWYQAPTMMATPLRIAVRIAAAPVVIQNDLAVGTEIVRFFAAIVANIIAHSQASRPCLRATQRWVLAIVARQICNFPLIALHNDYISHNLAVATVSRGKARPLSDGTRSRSFCPRAARTVCRSAGATRPIGRSTVVSRI